MGTNKEYNGHRNYNYWNVSLWIGNDEGLYKMAREAIRKSPNKDRAADLMFRWLTEEMDCKTTPDGVKWTKSAIRAAMVDM